MCDPGPRKRDKHSPHGVACPLHSEPLLKSVLGLFAIGSPVNRVDQTYLTQGMGGGSWGKKSFQSNHRMITELNSPSFVFGKLLHL